MFKYRPDIDGNTLDIPELNDLRKTQGKFNLDNDNVSLRKAYFDSTIAFLDWYLDYVSRFLKGKKYSDKQVCKSVFRTVFKTERIWKDYLLMSIYISQLYVEYLRTKIAECNIDTFNHTIMSLEVDLEWLIVSFEVQYKKNADNGSLNSGRRKNLSPTDIYSAARTLFHIEEFNSIKELYLRDLKPVVMFQIRQLLEIFGKNLIGYHSISDKDGNPIKKFTQISWDFINEENKKVNSRIEFPFDIDMIISINSWSNSFVHTTYIYNSYIQFYALKIIGLLFTSKAKNIRVYNGKRIAKFDIADIKISDYDSLKLDFENMLRARVAGVQVEWLKTDQVGAYIISE